MQTNLAQNDDFQNSDAPQNMDKKTLKSVKIKVLINIILVGLALPIGAMWLCAYLFGRVNEIFVLVGIAILIIFISNCLVFLKPSATTQIPMSMITTLHL